MIRGAIMARMEKVGSVATVVKVTENHTAVRYHNTDVVMFDSENIVLDNGGYLTLTTTTRMNQASNEFNLGYKVRRKLGEMIVTFKGVDYPFTRSQVLKR